MKIEYPDYLNLFQCIAGDCPDTCCAGWEVDVEDESYDYYQTVPGRFGDVLRSRIATEGGEHYFPLTPEGRCPFLNASNLCELYVHLGEESLCRVCTEYPRYYMQVGDYEQIDMSLSCMALGRIFFSPEEHMQILTLRDDSVSDGDPLAEDEEAHLQRVLELRNETLDEVSLNPSLVLDKLHDNAGDRELFHIIDQFEILNETCHGILQSLKKNPEQLRALERPFEKAAGGQVTDWFSRLYRYLVFRYFIDAYYDDDILREIRLCSRSLRLVYLMCLDRFRKKQSFDREDMVDLAHLFSKQVEHSDQNVEAMKLVQGNGIPGMPVREGCHPAEPDSLTGFHTD